MAIRHDSGIVLRSYPFGEADRVVILLSPQHGKLRTVAKGVRKTSSRFGGRLEPFNHVEVVLYEGHNLDTITQVESLAVFAALRADLSKVTAASAMVEVVDAVAQEKEPSVALFGLLNDGLTVLEEMPMHPDIVAAFLLHLTGVVGLAPSLDRCAACGSTTDLAGFGFEAGGAICSGCGTRTTMKLRPQLMAYLARLASSSLRDLPEPGPGLHAEALGLMRRFVEHHIERRLASLVVMDL